MSVVDRAPRGSDQSNQDGGPCHGCLLIGGRGAGGGFCRWREASLAPPRFVSHSGLRVNSRTATGKKPVTCPGDDEFLEIGTKLDVLPALRRIPLPYHDSVRGDGQGGAQGAPTPTFSRSLIDSQPAEGNVSLPPWKRGSPRTLLGASLFFAPRVTRTRHTLFRNTFVSRAYQPR